LGTSSCTEGAIGLGTGAAEVASGTAVAIVRFAGVVIVCGSTVGFRGGYASNYSFSPTFCVRPADLVVVAGEVLVVVSDDAGVLELRKVLVFESVNEVAVVGGVPFVLVLAVCKVCVLKVVNEVFIVGEEAVVLVFVLDRVPG